MKLSLTPEQHRQLEALRPKLRGEGLGSSPCCPSLDCSREELVAYIRSMKGGERVMEMGGSGMKGETGTVEIRESGVCIRWDTKFPEGSGMVTSFTGGARIIQDNAQDDTRLESSTQPHNPNTHE